MAKREHYTDIILLLLVAGIILAVLVINGPNYFKKSRNTFYPPPPLSVYDRSVLLKKEQMALEAQRYDVQSFHRDRTGKANTYVWRQKQLLPLLAQNKISYAEWERREAALLRYYVTRNAERRQPTRLSAFAKEKMALEAQGYDLKTFSPGPEWGRLIALREQKKISEEEFDRRTAALLRYYATRSGKRKQPTPTSH